MGGWCYIFQSFGCWGLVKPVLIEDFEYAKKARRVFIVKQSMSSNWFVYARVIAHCDSGSQYFQLEKFWLQIFPSLGPLIKVYKKDWKRETSNLNFERIIWIKYIFRWKWRKFERSRSRVEMGREDAYQVGATESCYWRWQVLLLWGDQVQNGVLGAGCWRARKMRKELKSR